MVELSVENFSIDPKEEVGSGIWYTHAGFEVAQTKKVLGILEKKEVFSADSIVFMISSDTLKSLPEDDQIDPRKFDTRLILPRYDETAIKNYVEQKVKEASQLDTVEEAFKYLEQFFLIDD